MLAVRHQYEEKVRQLQMRIRATEEERDKVLSNVNSVECETNEKVKKVKDEFEKKLLMLQRDLKKAEQAKRDYSRMQKQSSYHEKQLKTLQHELQEMKKTKVCLCPRFVTRKFCRILLSSSRGSTKYLENVLVLYEDNEFVISVDPVMNFPQTEKLMCYIYNDKTCEL